MTSSRARLRTPYPYPYLELACLIAVVDKIAYNSGMDTRSSTLSPYSLGVLLALEKVALFTPSTKLLLRATQVPLARQALLATLIGGVGGGAVGGLTSKNRSHGILRGALTGAGLGFGGLIGSNLFSARAAARAIENAGAGIGNVMKISPEQISSVGPRIIEHLEKTPEGKRVLYGLTARSIAGLGLGGLLGGAAGSAFGRSMIPPDLFVGSA